jgi:hypothetical protein
MFDAPSRPITSLRLSDVTLLTPVVPGKVLAMWNNFHALGKKLGWRRRPSRST